MSYDPVQPRPTFRPRGLLMLFKPVKVKRSQSRGAKLTATSCYWCGGGFVGPCYKTREHLTPLSAGGSNDRSNIAAACAPCNHSRGSIPHDEWSEAIDETMRRWPELDQHEIGPRARSLHHGDFA